MGSDTQPDYLPQHLKYLFDDVIGKTARNQENRISLIHVGHVIELLMGGTYRAQYTRKRFRLYYETSPENQTENSPYKTFEYPFHELLIWSVLMKRQEMAIFMWQQVYWLKNFIVSGKVTNLIRDILNFLKNVERLEISHHLREKN